MLLGFHRRPAPEVIPQGHAPDVGEGLDQNGQTGGKSPAENGKARLGHVGTILQNQGFCQRFIDTSGSRAGAQGGAEPGETKRPVLLAPSAQIRSRFQSTSLVFER